MRRIKREAKECGNDSDNLFFPLAELFLGEAVRFSRWLCLPRANMFYCGEIDKLM